MQPWPAFNPLCETPFYTGTAIGIQFTPGWALSLLTPAILLINEIEIQLPSGVSSLQLCHSLSAMPRVFKRDEALKWETLCLPNTRINNVSLLGKTPEVLCNKQERS